MPQLNLPAQLDQLENVNNFLEQNTPPDFVGILPTVELVAEELLVNVFSYAYPDGATGTAEIQLRVVFFDNQQFLCFTVIDEGKPFNPFAEAPAPDLSLDTETRPIGGLGIYLIRQVSAHQAYTFENNHNQIDVYFALPEKDDA